MTDTELALLRSLVSRPVHPNSPATQAMIDRLRENGYVVLEQSGWVATSKGCVAVEQMRKARAGM